MMTARKFLIGAGAFGLVVAGVYWFITYEDAGAVLLLCMGMAPLVAAGYLIRHAGGKTPADRADARAGDAAGERIGTFVADTPWPAALALGSVLALVGLVYSVALVVLGACLAVLAVAGLIRDSSALD